MSISRTQNISPYYQTKITLVSFVLVLMMLFVHGIYNESHLFRISNIVLSVIPRLSYRVINPTYFTISGLLFFKGIKTITDCFPKMKKRIRTVLVPFVLWNAIAILTYLIFSHLPLTREFLRRDIISHFQTPYGAFEFCFIRPSSFHLWFLRDLIVYVALSPVLYWLIKRFGWFVAPIMLVATPPLMQWLDLNHLEIAFFILGGTIAMHSSLEAVKAFLSRPFVLVAAFFYFGLSAIWDFVFPKQFVGEEYLSIFFSICGMITLWRGYDYLARTTHIEQSSFLLSLTNYSFFIYLFHEPILFILMQLGKILFGVNGISLTLLYLINPVLIICLGIVLAKGIKKISPTLYSVLVGGRITRFRASETI